MPVLLLLRLAILRNLSSDQHTSRMRARHLAARLSRRHGFCSYT